MLGDEERYFLWLGLTKAGSFGVESAACLGRRVRWKAADRIWWGFGLLRSGDIADCKRIVKL